MSRADLKPNQRAHLPVEIIAVSEKPKAGAPVVPHGGWSSRAAPQTICFPCTTTQVTEILLLNHKLLAALVVELGGDWNTTTVNELTVVPSEDVVSCIRGLHISGALVRPLQRGTLVRTWRSLMTAAGVAPPALGAPLSLSAPAPTPSLAVGPRSRRGKRTASDAGWEGEEARARAWLPAWPKHGAAPEPEELSALDRFAFGRRFNQCVRSEVGEARHHQTGGGLGRARVSLDWSAAVRALQTAKSSAPTCEAVVGRGKRRFSAVLQAGDEREFHMLLTTSNVARLGGAVRGEERRSRERLRRHDSGATLCPQPRVLHRTKLRTQTSPSSTRSASGP